MSILKRVVLGGKDYKGAMYDGFPKIYNIFVIGFVSCVSGLMFGFDISSMSSMLDTDAYKDYFNHPDSLTKGAITASMGAGSFFGSLISSSFTDVLGRRVALHLCSLLWIVGAALQCASQNRAMLILGRVISGIGIGFGSSVTPVYCSEISPPRIRGAIGGIFQLCITIGIMVLFYIGYGGTKLEGTAVFRFTWGMQLVPGTALLIAVFFLPESPRWLANHGRWDEVLEVVSKVTAHGDTKDPDVLLYLEEIREQVALDKVAKSFGYKDLFRSKTRPKTIVGVCSQMWQQLCGMNVMMYYIVFIFQMAGYRGNQNLISASIQYVLNVLMTVPALLLVDTVGRRPILLTGGVLMTIWLFAVAGLLAVHSEPVPRGTFGDDTVTIAIPEGRRHAAQAVIACSYLFVCSFATTWGVGIWLYCPELFNNLERAKGAALTTSVNWAFNFALAMFVPSAFKNISWRTYIVFGVFCVAMTINTYLKFPETKGKTLEEIDQMWASGVPAWRSKSFIPVIPTITTANQEGKSSVDNTNEEVSEEDKIGT